jgi:hypothetical protein
MFAKSNLFTFKYAKNVLCFAKSREYTQSIVRYFRGVLGEGNHVGFLI